MKKDNVESISELSPVQQGMLFHSLYAPGSGVYVVQLSVRLRGKLDAAIFAQAWQRVADRHGALRTSFHWEKLEKPVQVVHQRLAVKIERTSWRDLPPHEVEERLQNYLRADRRRGFELPIAPLMRWTLFELDEGTFQFVWSFHHLCLDGWSCSLILREVFRWYHALSCGQPLRLPRPRPFRHYVAWLLRQQLSEAKSFWQQELAGLGPPTLLGRRRAAGEDRSHGRHQLALSAAATARLQAAAQRLRLTLNTLLQGAWALLLAHYGGRSDIVFGATTAGRPAELPGVESMAGMFINTLPVRVRVSPDEYLGPWLERLQARQAELRRFEHSPLDQVQKWSGIAAGEALFDNILVFESFPTEATFDPAVPGLEIAAVEPFEQTNYPLTVVVAPGPELLLRMDYDRRRFTASEIRRLAGHWRNLLHGFAADPQRRLRAFPLLSPAERQQILREWTATAVPYPLDRCLHELIAAQVERTPAAVAVVFEDRALSYRELEARAERLAATLDRRGVGPDVAVGVFMERSPDLVVALYGILKAGGAYLPLEPSYPRDRVRFMLTEARVPVVLTQERLRARVPAGEAEVLCVDAPAAADPPAVSRPRARPDQLAYAIYTSGSTGQPKGSTVSHRAIVNRLLWMQDQYRLRPGEGVVQKTPFSFDVSVWEFFWPLMVGARLVVARPGGHRDGAYLAALIARHEVTTVHFVPSMLQAFVDEPGLVQCRCLRRVIASGEALPGELAARFFERSGAALHNLYGPTEAAVDVTFWACERQRREETIPIGRPIANLGLRLLDRRGDPVPPGVAGELGITGLGLARGYLRQPALTAASFVPDPFSPEPGQRLYRTGDLALWRPDGAIEFLGRIDHQVKVRGFRIELGEIETVLAGHPAVREVIVTARREKGLRLVAWVVAEKTPPTVGQLQAFVREKLPEYMVPAIVALLDALPQLPNGKVDRGALSRRPLPAPDQDRERLATPFVAPRNATEQALAEIWAEVLGCRRVGASDDFFELGGDSILSIRVVSKARRAGLRLVPRDLFRYPTIAALAVAATPMPIPKAEPGPVRGRVPLTPIQHWFLDRDLVAPGNFNQAVVLELAAPLEAGLLKRALGVLLEHHDALRLRLFRQGPEWRQVNEPPGAPVPFARVDLAALGPAQDTQWRRAAAAVRTSLDLSRGPLVRLILVAGGAPPGGRLLWVIHHLAVDGVSWRILLEDLERVYRQLESGAAVSLPPKTTSFRSWAERLAEHAGSAAAGGELDFWLRQAPADRSELPADHPGGLNTAASARTVTASLPAAETRALLREVHRAYRTRINDLLLAALVRSFAQWTGQETLLVDLEGHGREELFEGLDLSRSVGWFTSVFPVLLERAGDPGDQLKAVKERLRAIPGGGVGWGLLRYLNPETAPRLRELPPARVTFNYLGQLDPELPASSPLQPVLGAVAAIPAEGRRRYLLEINAGVARGELRLDWTYSGNLHRRATIVALAAGFLEALQELIRHCLAPGTGGYTPSDFPEAGLDQAGIDQLLAELGGPEAGLPEAFYPLSPAQQGMLFFAVMRREPSALLKNQVHWVLSGELEVALFQKAWRQVIARHAVLRTFLLWEGRERPLQVVRPQVELPWVEEDWRHLPAAQQEEQLRAFLAADRHRDFDFSRPPLMRLTLVRTGSRQYHFIWTYHQLILDGWSVQQVLAEVFACSRALRTGTEPQLPPPRPYRDFVAWIERQDAEAAEAFWRRRLAGFEEATLTGLERPTAGTGTTGRCASDLGPLQAPLKAAARDRGLTLNTVLQGAWALLLSRYGGAAEVFFGTVVAGRPPELEGYEAMVGLFINALPVRVRVAPEVPGAAWLAALQAEQAEVRQFEYCPVEHIQRWLGVPWSQPLFQNLFIFENYPLVAGRQADASAVAIEQVEVEEAPNYPLNLFVMPGPRLELRLIYDLGRYDGPAMERMLVHLMRLLAALVRDPEQPVGALTLLAPGEREEVLSGLAATPDQAVAAVPELPVHLLFAARAERDPAAPAVIEDGEKRCYGELDRRANGLARRLAALEVGRGETVVGLCAERSFDMLVGMLGILKAGGTYLPLDPASPARRLAFMLEDAGARVLVTGAGAPPALAAAGRPVVAIAETPAADLGPDRRVDPDEGAYVIYTSGSTGQPKGVVVSHRSLAGYAVRAAESYRIAPGDRVLQFASASFDASAEEIYPTLLRGAALVLRPRELASAPEFLAWCRGRGITVLNLPTAYWHTLVADAGENRRWPEGVRLVVIGGEEARAAALRGWQQWVGDLVRLVNTYGPTEATIVATRWWPESGARAAEHLARVPIGRPVAGARALVLDRHLEPVAVGVPGELFLGGDGVARGYLARPALTARRFVPDPFGPTGARLYATGDRVRWREDGELEFLGRLDHQVKVRGFRIEIGEIEAVLTAHPQVREAAVVAVGGGPGRDGGDQAVRLMAHVVGEAASDQLRDFLAQRLPEYMVPAAFLPLDALPLTPGGKVDRAALAGRALTPEDEQDAAEATFVGPRNETEQMLAEIFTELLGREGPAPRRVSVFDSFFELGGHSLLATRLATRVRDLFAVDLPLREIFQAPTVSHLGVIIEELVIAQLEELSEEEATLLLDET